MRDGFLPPLFRVHASAAQSLKDCLTQGVKDQIIPYFCGNRNETKSTDDLASAWTIQSRTIFRRIVRAHPPNTNQRREGKPIAEPMKKHGPYLYGPIFEAACITPRLLSNGGPTADRRPPTTMEAGGGGAEEEQVMSEVHLGCSPHFSGLHISRFSFSSRPIGTSRSCHALFCALFVIHLPCTAS
jgi:hypothetical protein